MNFLETNISILFGTGIANIDCFKCSVSSVPSRENNDNAINDDDKLEPIRDLLNCSTITGNICFSRSTETIPTAKIRFITIFLLHFSRHLVGQAASTGD